MAADRDERANASFVQRDSNPPAGALLPGSLASLDSTLPPTPLKELLAADGASIFVLTSDHALAQAVEQAGGEQYPIYCTSKWRDLLEAVREGRTHIVLLDADALPSGLDAPLAALGQAGGALVVVVAAKRDEAQPLMALLSERRIHRLLIKPAAPGITRLLLESAISRYLQIRETLREPDVRITAEADVQIAAEPRRRRPAYKRERMGTSWLAAIVIVAALLGVVVAGDANFDFRSIGWGWSEGSTDSSESGSVQLGATQQLASTETGTGTDASADLAADGAIATEAAITAIATGAASSADAAMASDADGGASADDAEAGAAADDAEAGVAADDADTGAPADAVNAAAAAAAADAVGDVAVAAVAAAPSAVIDADAANAAPDTLAVDTAPADPAFRDELAAAPAAVDDALAALLANVETRLAQGLLLEPPDESALAYFERAVALNGADPRVVEARALLAASFVGAARMTLEADPADPFDADTLERARLLSTEAFRLGADRDALARLDREVLRRRETLERHSALLAAAQDRLREGALIDPAEDNARAYLTTLRAENPAHEGLDRAWQAFTVRVAERMREAVDAEDWASADAWIAALEGDGGDPDAAATLRAERVQAELLATPVPASTMRLLDEVPPVYPEDARRRGIEGWVELEFIVDTDGSTREIVVVESRPIDRFAEAAVATITQQRYAPFEQDGRRYARRLTMRMRFTLE